MQSAGWTTARRPSLSGVVSEDVVRGSWPRLAARPFPTLQSRREPSCSSQKKGPAAPLSHSSGAQSIVPRTAARARCALDAAATGPSPRCAGANLKDVTPSDVLALLPDPP
jgi:hypothetical protein